MNAQAHPCPDADLWILAGQSNMQGCGPFDQPFPEHPRIWAFGSDYRWAPGVPPLHHLHCAHDPVHDLIMLDRGHDPAELKRLRALGREGAARAVGPGYFFARELLSLIDDARTIALLPVAHGGSSLDEWAPDRPEPAEQTLYGAMLKRLAASGLKPRGVLWYQGESDAQPGLAETYGERFKRWVTRLREDVADADLPILTVQLARVTSWGDEPRHWDRLRREQLQVAREIPGVELTTALDGDLADQIHIDQYAQARLGRRLARQAATLVYGAGEYGRTILPESVTVDLSPLRTRAVVRFAGLTGALRSADRPGGFQLTMDALRPEGPALAYRVDLNAEGPGTVAVTGMPEETGIGVGVAYGKGFDPYCNITDEADMALPAFELWPNGERADR